MKQRLAVGQMVSVCVSCIVLLTACSGGGAPEELQIPVPVVTAPEGPRPTRCESVLMSDSSSGKKMYRNFYIEIHEDHTESVVNQVDSNEPCP